MVCRARLKEIRELAYLYLTDGWSVRQVAIEYATTVDSIYRYLNTWYEKVGKDNPNLKVKPEWETVRQEGLAAKIHLLTMLGYSLRRISAALGVSVSTVCRIKKSRAIGGSGCVILKVNEGAKDEQQAAVSPGVYSVFPCGQFPNKCIAVRISKDLSDNSAHAIPYSNLRERFMLVTPYYFELAA